MAISWAKGFQFKAKAEDAKRVMDELAVKGKLTAANLVEISKPEDAPLHNDFEWNDTIAAQKWREQTGRTMIAMIVVTPDKDEEEKTPVRCYFNIEKTSPIYTPTEVIFSDEAKTERLLEVAKRELKSFLVKYRTLTKLAGICNAIEELLDEDE